MNRLAAVASVLLLAAVAQAQTCVFTGFGRPCGGNLSGQQVTTRTATTVRLDGTALAPGAIAVLVLGQQAASPITLPGSNCLLLVQHNNSVVAQADRTGAVAFRFPIPARLPMSVDIQVVTIGFTRNGRIAESTNGLTVACR